MGTIHRVEARSIVPMKKYWLCQLAVFVVILALNSSILATIGFSELTSQQISSLSTRALLTSGFFILFSHFVIRNGSQWLARKRGMKRPTLALLLVMSVLAAALYHLSYEFVVQTIAPSALPSEEVSMQVQGSKIEFHENKRIEWVAIFIKCSMYWLWSGCYLAVIARREKRMLKTQLKEQQLASLQNQINPHFLFNSLNTIRGMIYQDQDKAAEIVTQLSELFRYNLTTDLRTHVSVEDEWQICENYLAIEQVRFGERLKVHFDCPQNLLKATLPSMSLLTMVENAVKHGIAHLPNGGELKIHVSEREGKVQVQVINPFDEARVKSGTQLGLANIQSRLELMFGQQAKLLISQERQQFKAIMEVPYAA